MNSTAKLPKESVIMINDALDDEGTSDKSQLSGNNESNSISTPELQLERKWYFHSNGDTYTPGFSPSNPNGHLKRKSVYTQEKKTISLKSQEEHLDLGSSPKQLNADLIPSITDSPPPSKKKCGDLRISVAPITYKKWFLASLTSNLSSDFVSHPEVNGYKVYFQEKKQELVSRLFKLYNEEIFEQLFPKDISFTWNDELFHLAGCSNNQRELLFRLPNIELSTKIVDRPERVRDVLIHQMCHTASWLLGGQYHGHGALWQKWADRAINRFPNLPQISKNPSYAKVNNFLYLCTTCGQSAIRHSAPNPICEQRCGNCWGKFELLVQKPKKGEVSGDFTHALQFESETNCW